VADAKILVIDDEEDMLENYRRLLTARGWTCVACADAKEAFHGLESDSFDFIITDLRMPGVDGIEVVRRARQADPTALVVVATAYASVESAVAAVKEGAYDYISKPFTGDELCLLVERALKERRLAQENVALKRRLELEEPGVTFVGTSPSARRLWEQVARVAPSDAGVFVVGESGTGKELVARGLHARSTRAKGPFIPVDCVALPRDLIEGELFGSEKGAFTSAVSSRMGLFECANSGTLFLDEICELDIDMQAKLLRVLQERQFRRLGGRQLLTIDVRIVAATNRDPKRAVDEGKLREDLFYRLDVVRISVPSLRERRDDVPLLLEHFFRTLRSSASRPIAGFAPETVEVLQSYDWPGNVRELRNVVEQSVLLAKGAQISVTDLPAHVVQSRRESAPKPDVSGDYKQARKDWIAAFERRYVEKLLAKHDSNVSKAAEEAGVDRKTLYRIIREHGLH
jgi:two-component system response regulator AtoC